MTPKWLPGGLWAALGASGRPLGGHPAATSIFDRFSASFWLPFWSQNGPKLKPDFEEKACSDLNSLFLSSGGLWGTFLIDFGIILGSFSSFFDSGGQLRKQSLADQKKLRKIIKIGWKFGGVRL